MKAGSLLDLHPQGCDPRLGMKFYRRGHAQGHASRDMFRSISLKVEIVGFPGGAVVESLPANAGDTGSSPGLGRSHMPRSN